MNVEMKRGLAVRSDKALVRHQFMEFLLRLSHQRFVQTGRSRLSNCIGAWRTCPRCIFTSTAPWHRRFRTSCAACTTDSVHVWPIVCTAPCAPDLLLCGLRANVGQGLLPFRSILARAHICHLACGPCVCVCVSTCVEKHTSHHDNDNATQSLGCASGRMLYFRAHARYI